MFKLPERIQDGKIRAAVEGEIGEEQEGCRKGGGTTDGMFAVRQLVVKKWKDRKLQQLYL